MQRPQSLSPAHPRPAQGDPCKSAWYLYPGCELSAADGAGRRNRCDDGSPAQHADQFDVQPGSDHVSRSGGLSYEWFMSRSGGLPVVR